MTRHDFSVTRSFPPLRTNQNRPLSTNKPPPPPPLLFSNGYHIYGSLGRVPVDLRQCKGYNLQTTNILPMWIVYHKVNFLQR